MKAVVSRVAAAAATLPRKDVVLIESPDVGAVPRRWWGEQVKR
jgi:hypothetical protein